MRVARTALIGHKNHEGVCHTTRHSSGETTKDPIILACETEKGLDQNQAEFTSGRSTPNKC